MNRTIPFPSFVYPIIILKYIYKFCLSQPLEISSLHSTSVLDLDPIDSRLNRCQYIFFN